MWKQLLGFSQITICEMPLTMIHQVPRILDFPARLLLRQSFADKPRNASGGSQIREGYFG